MLKRAVQFLRKFYSTGVAQKSALPQISAHQALAGGLAGWRLGLQTSGILDRRKPEGNSEQNGCVEIGRMHRFMEAQFPDVFVQSSGCLKGQDD